MADLYLDRRMLKWLPFQALPEQGDDIRALYKGLTKEERPLLSEDQLESMQWRFEEAYQRHEKVVVTTFEHSQKKDYEGVIVGFDQTMGLLFLDQKTVHIDRIIAIE